jgi:hypothetical protein
VLTLALALAPAVALAAGLVGCAAVATPQSEGDPAATVEEVPGSQVKRITLSEVGAERLQVTTQAVAQGPTAGVTVVNYAAVVYDADGGTWVFARTAPNTFQREKVVLAGIDGPTARLSSGPPAGTAVVTVGAAELIGAEAGLGG